MPTAIIASACCVLASQCSDADVANPTAVDPNPNWRPPVWAEEIFSKLAGTPVAGHTAPLQTGGWRFAHLGGPDLGSIDEETSYHAIFERPQYDNEVPPFLQDAAFEEIWLQPRSIGDLGDVYFRTTGKSHPRLIGPQTAYYRASISQARQQQSATPR